MSRKPPADAPITLRDDDIGSERVVSRRSLLGILGVGVAAGAIMKSSGDALAADSDTEKKPAPKKAAKKSPPKKPAAKKAAPKKKKEETDAD